MRRGAAGDGSGKAGSSIVSKVAKVCCNRRDLVEDPSTSTSIHYGRRAACAWRPYAAEAEAPLIVAVSNRDHHWASVCSTASSGRLAVRW
jgi:hypothetical protein